MDEAQPSAPEPKPDSRRRKILLALLVVLLLAGTGAAVWFWRQTEIDELKASHTIPAADSTTTTNLIDPTDPDNWSEVLMGPTTVGSVEEGQLAGLSFRLPVAWTVLHCGNVSALAAYVSPTTDTQAQCNSDGGAPIVIVVQDGDIREGYDYSDTTIYNDQKTETVTVAGREFTRASATFSHPIEFMPAAGSTIVSYIAFLDGVSYAASYVHAPGDAADLTADFDKIVTITLAVTTP